MMLAVSVGSGGVIIDGGDRDDHGSSTAGPDGNAGTPDDINLDGWKYIQQMVNYAYTNSRNHKSGILVIGATEQKALSAITSVATVLNLPFKVATKSPALGQVDLATVNFDDYAMMYVPSNSPETAGGITTTDASVLTARKLDVQNFINRGGSLVALTEDDFPQPYSWLELPAVFTTAGSSSDSQYQTQNLIDAKLVITDADLKNGTPLHNSFTGPAGFNGLKPFVYNYGVDGKMGTPDDEVITLGLLGGVVGNPPVAIDDAASIAAATPVLISLLANDYGTDYPIDPTTIVVVDQPAHGTVSLDMTSGKALYKPDPQFGGVDTFTYRVSDTHGAVSKAAIVTIDVDKPPGPRPDPGPDPGSEPDPNPQPGPPLLTQVSPPPVVLSDPPIESPIPILPTSLPLLLLVYTEPSPKMPNTPVFGASGGITVRKLISASVSAPQVVDAAFGSDEIDKPALLANFLDFVEPEALIVDLGDEPPAKISVDVTKAAAIEVLKPAQPTDKPPIDEANVPSHSGASTNQPGATLMGFVKPAGDGTVAAVPLVVDTSVSSSLANNWKLVATGGGVLLLLAAAWTSRSKWVRVARKLRWR